MSLENTSEVSEFIGSGSFGDVFVGRYNTRKVAIKRFKVSQYAERQTAIDQEISILRHLQCRHIIQFMGVRREDDHIYLITDFAEGGSLKSAIDSGRTADWSLKRRVAQEIANGLAYIHHENILHRDLKSDNVLLTIHMEVKLCDFGFAVIKKSSEGHSTSAIRGTRLWLAPELLVEERPQYSNKSDMYAFGMVMWEMAAMCTHPFKHKSSIHAALLDVQKGEREKLPDHTSADYRQWVELCWRQDPTERPEAQETSLVEDVQLPPQHANNFISLSHDSSMLDSPVSDNSVYGGNTAVTASPDKDAARTDQILDPKKLARLWREAEEFDDADAQFSLAEMYEAGSGGVMKDDSRAFSLSSTRHAASR
ncbi:hypothetical protein DFQ27_000321 [Actinomortierella ambigua]|uniref:Protein kinase domain-containing protein n=1 Tax=Actinomortierella ambigua TaxID=1343610 RepID=A0A9P6QD03_9FUNG|nr:hypothetical protein DFQ27_000321 [Actinomortierella ambigua]